MSTSGTPLAGSGARRLFIVRHGRTEHNDRHLMQGWTDSPLTPDGVAEVRATAAALAPVGWHAAFTSPLPRCRTTAAELLAGRADVPLTVVDGLKEAHCGDLEGRPEAEAASVVDVTTFFSSYIAGEHPGLPGSAETGAQFRQRVVDAFALVVEQVPPGARALVVTHGATLSAYLAIVGVDGSTYLRNAGVSVVDVHLDGTATCQALDLDVHGVGGFVRAG